MAFNYDEHQASARGCTIHYRIAGDGPPVLFVHGGGGPHWWTFQDLLSQQVRLCAVDLPGYGDSTVSDQITSFYDVADVVAEVATAAGLERPGLIGESLGGLVSAWVAIRHPDLLSRLVLESAGGFQLPTVKPRSEMTPEEIRRALFRYPDRLPPGYGQPERQPRGFMPSLRDHGGREDDLKAHLPAIRIPTLILNGEHDGLVAPESGRIFRAHIPTAWRICVDDAAHVIHLDQPQLFTSLVAGFLLSEIAHAAPTGVA